MNEPTPADYAPLWNAETGPYPQPNQEYLTDIESPQALEWVQAHNKKTEDALTHSKEFSETKEKLLDVSKNDSQIPYVVRRGDKLYNFWTDDNHPRGIWRTTTLESYTSDSPKWEVLIDVDKLAEKDNMSWVWKGAEVRYPTYDRALIKLSPGGSDAVVIKEYDLEKKEFVTDSPFNIPEGKTSVSWIDKDTIFFGTDQLENSTTLSGYPAKTFIWKRGQRMEDAQEYYSIDTEDLSTHAYHDATPGYERTFAYRSIDFYNSETFYDTSDDQSGDFKQVPVPTDADTWIVNEWLFIKPRSEYKGIPGGALGVAKFDDVMAGTATPKLIYAPDERSSLEDISFTKNYLLITHLTDVSTAIEYAPLDDPTAQLKQLKLPEKSTSSVYATTDDTDEVWLSSSNFLTPNSFFRLDLKEVDNGSSDYDPNKPLKHQDKLFDAQGMETRQHWATSADGTKVPYFITGKFTDKPVPTLVYAYGGFEVAYTPEYSSYRGRAWLEKGNLYVLANIRGGGEFGPDWHSNAAKTNRNKAFEDHKAVLEDIVARGYATKDQVGIQGGSNGGLLTATALTQYPETFGAALIEVPLTDMLRYHTWLAGNSWIAEYGDPDKPEERAVLEKYSPVHHVVAREKRAYPPAFITSSTKDDRVHPGHARLFAAALEDAGQPVTYYENVEGGHNGAADYTQSAHIDAMEYTWLDEQLRKSDSD
ncbi:S9 family peptidase [Corynebacterium sp. sy017]|nr:S9 family peptidase [Corynebacterium sp. sy017]TSD91528.1 S9 family peptidase [Corynebacterium sp. SY003]